MNHRIYQFDKKISQLAVKNQIAKNFTSIFHSKALQSVPKLGILECKKKHLATQGARFFKAKLAPTEIFVPTQHWRPAQMAPRCELAPWRCLCTNSRLASL
jgi:hypothetical protein